MMAKPMPQTADDIRKRTELFKIYDYYGIPYGIFDEINVPLQVEKDWAEAVALIAQGEKIPLALEKRLLRYKAERMNSSPENE